jgi:hypothetical protein
MTFLDDDNPYAAPKAKNLSVDAHLDTYHEAWRDGKTLVVRREAELLDRCLKCAAPTDEYRDKFSRTVSWHRPIWFLLVFVSWPLYLIAYFIVRHRARVTVALCPLHRRKRARAITVAWLCAIMGLGSMIVAVMMSEPEPGPHPLIGTAVIALIGTAMIAGLLLFLMGSVFDTFGWRVLIPKRIDKHFVWLSRVSPDYLATLPDWNAPGDVAR